MYVYQETIYTYVILGLIDAVLDVTAIRIYFHLQEAPPLVKRIMKECWKLQSDKRPSFLLISTLLFKCHLQLV